MHCVLAEAVEPLLGTHLLTIRQEHWWHLGQAAKPWQLRLCCHHRAFGLRWWQCLGLTSQSERVSSILATQKSTAVSPLPKRSVQLLGFGLLHPIGTETFFSFWASLCDEIGTTLAGICSSPLHLCFPHIVESFSGEAGVNFWCIGTSLKNSSSEVQKGGFYIGVHWVWILEEIWNGRLWWKGRHLYQIL